MPLRVILAGVRTTPPFRIASAVGCAVWLVLSSAGSVAATTSLQNPVVAPNPAAVGSLVTFSVDYASVPPQPKDAASVEAELVRASDQTTITVPLVRQGGSLRAATWTGASSVPAGTWQVTFRGTDSEGGVTTIDAGAALFVTAPQATPTATVEPSPSPSPSVVPSAVPTPPSPGATPVASPRRTAVPQPVATPGRTPLVSASPSPVTTATPGSSVTAPGANDAASETPGSSPPTRPSDEAEPRAAQVDVDRDGSVLPWLVLGGGMATTGATILVAQVIVVRRRRGRL